MLTLFVNNWALAPPPNHSPTPTLAKGMGWFCWTRSGALEQNRLCWIAHTTGLVITIVDTMKTRESAVNHQVSRDVCDDQPKGKRFNLSNAISRSVKRIFWWFSWLLSKIVEIVLNLLVETTSSYYFLSDRYTKLLIFCHYKFIWQQHNGWYHQANTAKIAICFCIIRQLHLSTEEMIISSIKIHFDEILITENLKCYANIANVSRS